MNFILDSVVSISCLSQSYPFSYTHSHDRSHYYSHCDSHSSGSVVEDLFLYVDPCYRISDMFYSLHNYDRYDYSDEYRSHSCLYAVH